MKFKAEFIVPKIDMASVSLIDETLKEAISQAVMEWLNAVLGLIPVWSGASRATFKKLASIIGMNVPVDMASVTSREGIGESLSSGKVSFNDPPAVYTFEYSTELPWLIWNEYHNANEDPDPTKWPPPAKLKRPGPYEFQQRGYLAFVQFAKTVVLPDIRLKAGTKIKV